MTDKELNEAVARKLGWMKGSDSGVLQVSENSWAKGEYMDGQGYSGGIISSLPAYSTDISAAWEVLGRYDNLSIHKMTIDGRTFWRISDGYNSDHADDLAESDTAPRAICEAFLRLP